MRGAGTALVGNGAPVTTLGEELQLAPYQAFAVLVEVGAD